jgi:protein MPE1
VKTPCCSTTYCEECIHTSLLEHDFVCPNCESKIGSLDKVKPDETKREKVEEYVKGQVEKNKLNGPGQVEEMKKEEEETKVRVNFFPGSAET